MNPYVAAGTKKMNDVQSIIRLVELKYNVSIAQIRSRTRKIEVRHPRQVLAYLLLKHGLTIIKTGAIIRRNHATILHSRKVIEDVILTDKNERMKITELLNQIENVKI